MFIGNLELSLNTRPKIIAEIGINHGGSLDVAKKMSELAVEAGADVIKTQLHIAESEMSSIAKSTIPQHCNSSIFDIMEECSLSIDDEYKLKEFIESLGSCYLSTPFSADAAHILGGQFKVNAFKIGSGECNNPHVLKAVSTYNKPLLVSTGMNSLSSVSATYDFLQESNVTDVVLLHTTNIYPTPFELVRLGALQELSNIAGIGKIGLSDHTTSNLACLGAVALGAVVLERHFTDTMDRIGPDIINSMDPKQLLSLRQESELMFLMRGGSKVSEIPEEQDTRDFAFATIVALVDLSPGTKITFDNTAPKRPSAGDYQARDHINLIGKTVKQFINQGTHLMEHHFAD